MSDIPVLHNGTDTNLEQMIAREHYSKLREKLVALLSAPDPDGAAVDAVIRALEKAQMDYKATHGLIGNNAADDPQPG